MRTAQSAHTYLIAIKFFITVFLLWQTNAAMPEVFSCGGVEAGQLVQQKDLYGLCRRDSNRKVHQVVAPKFAYIRTSTNDYDRMPAKDAQSGLWGFIDTAGQWQIQPTFTYVHDFDGTIASVQKDKNYLLIDRSGNVVRDLGKNYIGQFENGYAVFFTGPADTKTSEACEKILSSIHDVFERNAYQYWTPDCARIDAKMTIVDQNMKQIIPPICDATTQIFAYGARLAMRHRMFACRINDKWGVMTLEQKMIVPPDYEMLGFNLDLSKDSKGRENKLIGHARKEVESGYFTKKIQLYEMLFDDGSLVFEPLETETVPQYENWLARKMFQLWDYVRKNAGIEKPFTSENYPFHFIGLIAAVTLTLGSAVFLKSKDWRTWQIAGAAPAVGVVGGLGAGFLAYLLYVVFLAAFIVIAGAALILVFFRR